MNLTFSTRTDAPRAVHQRHDSAPDGASVPNCWTAWAAWRTAPYGFARLIKTVQRELGPDARVIVDASLPSGLKAYADDEQPTEKELKRFRWLRITGSAADVRLEVELARRGRRSGRRQGKGAIVRTWGTATNGSDRARAIHDAVAAEMDESAIAVAGTAQRRQATRDRGDRWLALLTWRRRLMLAALALVLPLPVVAAPFLPYELLPPMLQTFVDLCLCNETLWLKASAGAVAVSLVLTPRLLPAVSISAKPIAHRIGLTAPSIAGFMLKYVLT